VFTGLNDFKVLLEPCVFSLTLAELTSKLLQLEVFLPPSLILSLAFHYLALVELNDHTFLLCNNVVKHSTLLWID
jgi:hypothetical protein